MPLSRPLKVVYRKVLADLKKKGLISYCLIYDPETGESIKKWIVTDEARKILNKVGRAE